MAKIYNPSEFLKVNKLREIPVEKGVLAKFKEAFSIICHLNLMTIQSRITQTQFLHISFSAS